MTAKHLVPVDPYPGRYAPNADNRVYSGTIIVTAANGWVGAARGLIGGAIRKVLGKRSRYHTAPHHISYLSAREAASEGLDAPRFMLTVTGAQLAAIMVAIARQAHADGWDRAPIDSYVENDETAIMSTAELALMGLYVPHHRNR